jgi:hypothetical protein
LTYYISSHHTYPTAQEISNAQDIVKQQTEALTSRKRKRVDLVGEDGMDHSNISEGSVKKKKGAVEENSRTENEEMLRGLFTNTRTQRIAEK